jgi:quercetin dioxygenase-like cupin family protein/heme-degrading monooxygenase HmoA
MEIIDLKEKESVSKEGRKVCALIEEPYLQINHVCLEAGGEVPRHKANSNVALYVLCGEGALSVDEESERMETKKLFRVPFGASMGIRNASKDRLEFLVIKAPHPDEMKEAPAQGREDSHFVNIVRFPKIKEGKERDFVAWFKRSSEIFARHPGFLSRRLLKSTEEDGAYAAIVEHRSKETFMAMHLSDERQELFGQVKPLMEGMPTPEFYQIVTGRPKG